MGLIVDLVPPPPDWASAPGAPAPSHATRVAAVARASSASSCTPSAPATAATTCRAGRLGAAAARQPVVDLERAQPRDRARAGGREPHPDRGLRRAVPRACRRRLERAARHRPRTGHDPDRRARAGGRTFERCARAVRQRWPRCGSCARCTASTRPTARCSGTAAQRARLPDDSGRARAVRRDQNPACSTPPGSPTTPTPSTGLPPNQATPDEPDYAELAELPKLERTLDTLQRVYGSDTQFPIWSTEFGYQTTPPAPGAGTVTPDDGGLLPELV